MLFFRNYPEKIDSNRVPNIHILVRCGIGDLYAHITRLPSLQKEYPNSRIYFYVGGGSIIPQLLADVLAPYPSISGVHVLEGYWKRSERRMKRMLKYIRSNTYEGDIVLNWIPTEAPLSYPMNVPFSPRVYKEDEEFVDEFFEKNGLGNSNTIAIHPISTKGNAQTFEKDRFWESEKWIFMVNKLIDNGYKILLLGAQGEEHGIQVDQENIFSFQGTTIRQTISALTKVKGLLCTSSWTWEVPAYHGLPVAVLWGVRYEHSRFLLPENQKLENVYIETNMQTDPSKFCQGFLDLLK